MLLLEKRRVLIIGNWPRWASEKLVPFSPESDSSFNSGNWLPERKDCLKVCVNYMVIMKFMIWLIQWLSLWLSDIIQEYTGSLSPLKRSHFVSVLYYRWLLSFPRFPLSVKGTKYLSNSFWIKLSVLEALWSIFHKWLKAWEFQCVTLCNFKVS